MTVLNDLAEMDAQSISRERQMEMALLSDDPMALSSVIQAWVAQEIQDATEGIAPA